MGGTKGQQRVFYYAAVLIFCREAKAVLCLWNFVLRVVRAFVQAPV
jgi:hypothetical protein